MKKGIYVCILFLTFFVFIVTISSYKINKIEKDFFIKGHYLSESQLRAPTNNIVNINIHSDNKIEIYSDKLNYTSYLKKYDKNIYTFKNSEEEKVNLIFFKNEKLYLFFNQIDDISVFIKVYEAPKNK